VCVRARESVTHRNYCACTLYKDTGGQPQTILVAVEQTCRSHCDSDAHLSNFLQEEANKMTKSQGFELHRCCCCCRRLRSCTTAPSAMARCCAAADALLSVHRRLSVHVHRYTQLKPSSVHMHRDAACSRTEFCAF
jgi:hypothetical protein